MESGGEAVVGESRRELLSEAEIAGEPPSWRLNINEFRLPERGSDQRNQSFSIHRLLRKSMCVLFARVCACMVCARMRMWYV